MTHSDLWIEENIPNLAGKLAIVTGANGGLGFQTTMVLARKGAQVVLAVRDAVRGARAMDEIGVVARRTHLEVMTLDLASLASVRRFADAFLSSHARLDLLINSAGVMAIPRRLTADGFEMQFGVNHLGHFALTGLLLPLILRTPGSRVVTVSSGAHQIGRINFADLHGERRYQPWLAYAQSKLANLLFAYELQRRLAAAGSQAISVAAHPGYAATNLQMVGPRMSGSQLGLKVMAAANRFLAQSAAMGALPIICAAACPEVVGGDYIGPGGFLGRGGFPKKVTSSARSRDRAVAAQLWTVSTELTGVNYAFD